MINELFENKYHDQPPYINEVLGSLMISLVSIEAIKAQAPRESQIITDTYQNNHLVEFANLHPLLKALQLGPIIEIRPLLETNTGYTGTVEFSKDLGVNLNYDGATFDSFVTLDPDQQ